MSTKVVQISHLNEMYPKIFLMLFVIVCSHTSGNSAEFTYNGFRAQNLILDGAAEYKSNGLITLTNSSLKSKGHAFYPEAIRFKSGSTTFSFSTTFVFAIVSVYPPASHHGLAFAISPTRGLPGAEGANYLGLLNRTTNGNSTNHVFAVEFDTFMSDQFNDPDDNHVGIDINSLNSTKFHPAGYFGADNNPHTFTNLTLTSGVAIQVWVDYNATSRTTDVTLAPVRIDKPSVPLLSLQYDLTPILNEFMYVGFSSASGRSTPTDHYLLGWSFNINGPSAALEASKLPKLPRNPKVKFKYFTRGLPVIIVLLVVLIVVTVVGIILWVTKKRKSAK